MDFLVHYPQRAVRRQELSLLINFLTVNRTLQEIKRDTQRSLVMQGCDSTSNRRPSLSGQPSKSTTGPSHKAAQQISSISGSKFAGKTDITRICERTGGFDEGSRSGEIPKGPRDATEHQEITSHEGISYEKNGIAHEDESSDTLKLIVVQSTAPRGQEHLESPEHGELFLEGCGESNTLADFSQTQSRCRSCSCYSISTRRESGYGSCFETDNDDKARTRSCSSSSSVSSFSSRSMSLSLSSEVMSPSSSYSSQLPISPPISASISSLIF